MLGRCDARGGLQWSPDALRVHEGFRDCLGDGRCFMSVPMPYCSPTSVCSNRLWSKAMSNGMYSGQAMLRKTGASLMT